MILFSIVFVAVVFVCFLPEGWMKKKYCTYSITLVNNKKKKSFVSIYLL